MMNFLRLAVAGQVTMERRRFGDREYIVVPVVPLVTGVHNDLLYDDDANAKAAQAWNGVPVTMRHPGDDNGGYRSANDPRVLQECAVGRLYNVAWNAVEHKLVGELYLDPDRLMSIAPLAMSYLTSGRPLEVSTGLWADEVPGEGDWNGEHYRARLINHVPDHLALLPGEEGACNWQDGCGVRVNVRSSARTPKFDGTESVSWAGVSTTFTAYRDAYYRRQGGRPDEVPSRVADAPAAMRNWIAGKTLLGEGGADNERGLIFFPVVNPGTGKLNEGALRAVIGGRGSQANIPEQAKESAQRKARSLLNRHFDADLEVNEDGMMHKFKVLWQSLVVDGLGKLFANEPSHDDIRHKLQTAIDALDNAGWIHFVRDVYDNDFVYEARGSNPSEGGLAGTSKLYKQGYAATDDGEVTLSGDPVEVVEKREYVPVSNQGAEPQITNSATPTEEKGAMDPTIKEIADALIANDKSDFGEDDREWLEAQELQLLQKIVPCAAAPPAEAAPVANASEPSPPAAVATPPEPAATMPSVDEYVNAAPEEVRETLTRALERDKAQKDTLVAALLANERCKFTAEQLANRSIAELEALAALGNVPVDYSGAGGNAAMPVVNDDAPPPAPQVWDLAATNAATG